MKDLERQRAYRLRTNNASTKRYEKTPNGFLMRMYRNMQSRVQGIQKLKAHLYKGKGLLGREDFYKWAKDSDRFWELFGAYCEQDCAQKLAPTVDRINPLLGYSITNMEWVTHSENSRRGAINRNKQVKI